MKRQQPAHPGMGHLQLASSTATHKTNRVQTSPGGAHEWFFVFVHYSAFLHRAGASPPSSFWALTGDQQLCALLLGLSELVTLLLGIEDTWRQSLVGLPQSYGPCFKKVSKKSFVYSQIYRVPCWDEWLLVNVSYLNELFRTLKVCSTPSAIGGAVHIY